jgi:hypothetical protein
MFDITTDSGPLYVHTVRNMYDIQLIMLILLPTAIRNMEEK